MDKKQLTDLEEKFCLIYTSGPAPYIGNASKTYDLVFNSRSGQYHNTNDELDENEKVEAAISGQRLIARDEIRERIDELQSLNVVNAATLRPRLTETLLKIADECSTSVYEDKFGNKLSPANLRSVAVSAISKLTDMYGIKEDIAHKVMLESNGGDGITFNLIVPEAAKPGEDLVG